MKHVVSKGLSRHRAIGRRQRSCPRYPVAFDDVVYTIGRGFDFIARPTLGLTSC